MLNPLEVIDQGSNKLNHKVFFKKMNIQYDENLFEI